MNVKDIMLLKNDKFNIATTNFKIKTSEPKILQNPSQNLYPKVPRRTDVIGEFCNLLHETKKNIF